MKDPSAPSSFGAWLNYSATHYPGAVSFLIMDFFLFFGVAVLTVVQASQVKKEVIKMEFFHLSLIILTCQLFALSLSLLLST